MVAYLKYCGLNLVLLYCTRSKKQYNEFSGLDRPNWIWIL